MRNGGLAAAIARAELERVKCPEGAEHVYGWFLDLSARRDRDQGEPLAVTFDDIECWQRVRRVSLLPHELQWILALDRRWFRPEKMGGE